MYYQSGECAGSVAVVDGIQILTMEAIMAQVILVQAVKGEVKSQPFKMYLTEEVKLPKKFVLRLDQAEDMNNGEPAIKVNNMNVKLIATHSKEYIESRVEGFRYKQGDVVYVVATQVIDTLPAVSALEGTEAF